jgi:hypothetical protein
MLYNNNVYGKSLWVNWDSKYDTYSKESKHNWYLKEPFTSH